MSLDQQAGWVNEGFQEDGRGRNGILFREVQVQNKFKSKQEGRPIFEPKTFIKILVAGDSSTVIDRPLREEDKDNYPVQWARWEQSKENKIPGTPIDLWPALSETQKAEFNAMKIYTIDQFANLGDSAAAKIMGFNDLRKAAQRFIAATRDAAQYEKLQEESDKKLAVQAEQIAAQAAELAEMRSLMERVLEDREAPKSKKT